MCGCERGCGRGYTRREFLAGSTVAAIGALLASACGDGIIGGVGPSDPTAGLDSFSIKLADYPALASPGGMALITGGPIPMVAVRTGAATFDVFSRICPHAGAVINIAGTGFQCPNHGAQWNAQGTWIGGFQAGGLGRLQATFDTAAGLLLVQGNSGNIDMTVRIAAFPSLAAVGGLARVDGNTGIPIGVARLGPETFAAYGLACPHEQFTIDPTGNGWHCRQHGARFAADGALLQGPATVGLTPLAVTYDAAAGTLRLRGTAAPSKRGDD